MVVNAVVLEINYSVTEQIFIVVDGANTRVRCNHEGGAVSPNVLAGGLSVATNYRCGYTWDATANTHAVMCTTSGTVTWDNSECTAANVPSQCCTGVGTGNCPDDEDSETVDGFDDSGAVDPSTLAIGEDISQSTPTDTIRIWDVYLVPGYKATDPGSL